ncbi:zeta toxin family protein [Tomitella biformata]|uniref:zeta toxin family protein n=1 Tax=Tomitella biformata TaxID=630403 RepID=UPI000462ECCD|nr:zeta toxin family protein [Tomitella biformata]
MKRLDLIVGSNGAGKSTFVQITLGPLLPRSVFVNADEIAKERWPHDPVHHSYDAARVATATRSRLIELGRSFIAETEFSHPSKLDLVADALAAGYEVHLHVVLIPEDLAVERVAWRVHAGGYWKLVATAIDLADTATVYDNSSLRGPRVVARMSGGFSVGAPAWPAWSPEALAARWPTIG